MTAAVLNLTIEKKTKFNKEFQVLLDNGEPRSFEGRVLQCIIKESHATDTVLHNLTEANGGVLVINDANGEFALVIDADETNVTADYGVYTVNAILESDPTTDIERLLEGRITYTRG